MKWLCGMQATDSEAGEAGVFENRIFGSKVQEL